MRIVIQRVSKASVTINKDVVKSIKQGLVILLGIENGDTYDDLKWLCEKIAKLRVFDDRKGVMNLSVNEIGGEILLISQFTLHASTQKGNRPSYIRAARPEIAIPLYEEFILKLSAEINKTIVTGEFGAHMDIEIINDGPVTIIIDSKNRE